jgi:hypothetical protein
MLPPSGFKRQNRCWFECASCRYRAYEAFIRVAVSKSGTQMLWQFWCPSCGRLSLLSNAGLTYGFQWLALFVLFIGALGPMLMLIEYLSPGFPLLWAAGFGVIVSGLASYLVFPVLTRLMSSYVAAPDSAL